MPLRLVLDTNVVLDLLHFDDAAARPLLAALTDGSAECWVDEATLAELQRVSGYPELKLDADAGAALCARYRQLAHCASTNAAPVWPLPRCRDPDDQKFLELATRVRADWLISKDKALLILARTKGLGFRILAPGAASAELGQPDAEHAAIYQHTTVRP